MFGIELVRLGNQCTPPIILEIFVYFHQNWHELRSTQTPEGDQENKKNVCINAKFSNFIEDGS